MSLYRIARTVMVMSLAVVNAGCRDEPGPTQLATGPPVCREPPLFAAPDPAAPSMFELLTSPQLTAEQERLISLIRSRATSARVEIAELIADPATRLQVDARITFPVSRTRSFTALGERVETRATSHISWSGRLLGEHGDVQLVLTSIGMTGSLRSVPAEGASVHYGFEPIGDRLHAIVCVDASRFMLD